jgi:four helix bundle protein
MQQSKFDLEERLVDYTCCMINVIEALPSTRAGNYISGQLVRSCHSPAFNYGEAQGAESTKDFIHKMGIILKELKECRVALKIIRKKEMIKPIKKLEAVFTETEELIAVNILIDSRKLLIGY